MNEFQWEKIEGLFNGPDGLVWGVTYQAETPTASLRIWCGPTGFYIVVFDAVTQQAVNAHDNKVIVTDTLDEAKAWASGFSEGYRLTVSS